MNLLPQSSRQVLEDKLLAECEMLRLELSRWTCRELLPMQAVEFDSRLKIFTDLVYKLGKSNL
jgi:hypothetical protein